MRRQPFARNPEGRVELDICFDCQCIWFDHYEASQLTPGATLELFRLIHEHASASPRPIPVSARCPVCRRTLKLTHDLQRTNRFTYLRCPEWHGRFITFFQFLREKQFVRSLSGAEIARLRATVTQVRCSSCGAVVDIEKDAACRYCQAPLSILDADAVRRTLDDLQERERSRPVPSPVAAIDALIEGRRLQQRLDRLERPGTGLDLVREALDALLT